MSSVTFLSVDEVAERTTLHPVSVYRMIADGRIPSVKLGKRRLIPSDWLSNLESTAGDKKCCIPSGGAA